MNFDFKKYKHVPKISSGIIILSFLLPFFLVKCGGQTLAEIKGIDLMVGMDIKASDEGKHIEWNIFAIVAALCAVVGLIFAVMDKREHKKVSLIIACIGLLCLIIMALQMKMAAAGQEQALITIALGFGYYLAFIGFLVNSLFFGFKIKSEKNSTELKTFDAQEDVI